MTRALAGLLVLSTLAGCDHFDPCGNDEVRRVKSPDGAREAVVFARDCGATTSTSTQVSIVRAGKRLGGAGNALVADSNHGAARSDAQDVLDLGLEWLSPRALRISSPPGARIFIHNERAGGVDITYGEAK
jgi:hypothetical protein